MFWSCVLWTLILALLVTCGTASAQADIVESAKKPEVPALTVPPFLPAIPTNVITTFNANSHSELGDCLVASWLSGEVRFMLTAWYEHGGTNLLSLRLGPMEKEESFDWRGNAEAGGCTFPTGTEKAWVAFATKIRSRYQVLGGTMFVEMLPLKYLGKIERLTDGVVLESYLFVDAIGKYRVIDEPYLVGGVPSVDRSIYIGSNGHFFFPVERTGEKFLLTLEMAGELQRLSEQK